MNTPLPDNRKPTSIISLQLGPIFVEGFRWILLLLFALLLEKAAEGITLRVCNGAKEYSAATVFSPPFDHNASPLSMQWTPNWNYIIGFVQLLVTVIFAARYFVCLVDPLERICDPTEPRECALTDRLRRIHAGHIFLVVLVAVPEFLFLFHAATSFQSFHQWLMFLLMLVLWDSAVFFILLPTLPLAFLLLAKLRPYVGRFDRGLQAVANWFTSDREQGLVLSKRIDAIAHQDEKHYRAMADDLDAAIGAYGVWNLLDASVLVVGLLGLHHTGWDFSRLLQPNTSFEILWLLLLLLGSLIIVLRLFTRWKPRRRAQVTETASPSYNFAKGSILGFSAVLMWGAWVTVPLSMICKVLLVFGCGCVYMLLRHAFTSLFARVDWLVVISILGALLALTSKHRFETYCTTRQQMELLWAGVILVVTAYCSCRNYLSQRDLWHGHMTFLRGIDPQSDAGT